MGLDSVEIVMCWEESFGISITNENASRLRTPSMAIDLISNMLNAREDKHGTCLTLRAFHRLRGAFVETSFANRTSIRPSARLTELLPKLRIKQWDTIRTHCAIPGLPCHGLLSRRTVGELTKWMVSHAAKELKRPGEPWTRQEIRHVVRAGTAYVIGIEDFDDDDDFVHDLRID